MTLATPITVVRGRFLDIQNIVSHATEIAEQVRYIEDGVLITEQGKIRWFGTWNDAQDHLPANVDIQHYPEQLIIPHDRYAYSLSTNGNGRCLRRTAFELVKHLYVPN